MKATLALTFAALLAVCLVGCAAAPVVPGADVQNGTAVFSATGQSIIGEPGDPYSEITAKIAAATMAKANLLAKISGAKVSQGVTVGDIRFESQEASEEVAGWLARATVTYAEEVEEGLAPAEAGTVTATASLAIDPAELANLTDYAD